MIVVPEAYHKVWGTHVTDTRLIASTLMSSTLALPLSNVTWQKRSLLTLFFGFFFSRDLQELKKEHGQAYAQLGMQSARIGQERRASPPRHL